MKYLIGPTCLLYGVTTILLFTRDYLINGQTTHNLSFDILFGLILAVPFFIIKWYYSKPEKYEIYNSKGEKQ